MKYNEDAEGEKTGIGTTEMNLYISQFFFIAMPLKKNAHVYQFFDIY